MFIFFLRDPKMYYKNQKNFYELEKKKLNIFIKLDKKYIYNI